MLTATRPLTDAQGNRMQSFLNAGPAIYAGTPPGAVFSGRRRSGLRVRATLGVGASCRPSTGSGNRFVVGRRA